MTPDEPQFSPSPGGDAAGGDAADLADLLAKTQNDAAELKDAWMRAKAETENVRKQGQADVARAHRYAVDRFAAELLPVKDALELALSSPGDGESLREGVALTLKQLVAAFNKFDIAEIAAQGEKFDPHRHQAMAMIDSDAPGNTVVQVFQKGYLLNDRILRPALVAVAKPRDASAGDGRDAAA
ncbi:MAG: nucleotide exchange factor GrpE [Betaproteobacteria bacterium]